MAVVVSLVAVVVGGCSCLVVVVCWVVGWLGGCWFVGLLVCGLWLVVLVVGGCSLFVIVGSN